MIEETITPPFAVVEVESYETEVIVFSWKINVVSKDAVPPSKIKIAEFESVTLTTFEIVF